MALGIFEQLTWLTKKVKGLCCAVDKLKESEAGSYKVYTALLSQQSEEDPTAIILENTLGDIVWVRNYEGQYEGLLSGAFVENKTWVVINNLIPPIGDPISTVQFWVDSINSVKIVNYLNNFNAYDGFTNLSIEIRVYN
jgi:hypothetical protein